MISYRNLFVALGKAKIRYLVAGGVAVNLHQVQRATADLDLIIHLEPDNVLKFAKVMTKLGYKPKVPVDAKDFADPKKRKEWIETKNMVVFSFINPSNHFELIDIFVQEPKPFKNMDKKKMKIEAFGVTIPVIGLDDLIELKKEAGREKDLFDIAQLKKIKK
ncbi:MAG: hypothetical protein Q7T03_02090 [Deltaproteobacteria bacterium]|nr:hypothetical protein [Deltaproteobacteria bacterium]